MEQKDIELTEQERAYIRELLRETQSEFRDIFLKMSRIPRFMESFARLRVQLLEYVVPKQGELLSFLSSNLADGETQSCRLSDEFWALRAGDLRPEKIEHMGFSQRFCKILEKDGLLFKSRDEAEDASAKARAQIKSNSRLQS